MKNFLVFIGILFFISCNNKEQDKNEISQQINSKNLGNSINKIILNENIPGASIGILINDSIVFNEGYGFTDTLQTKKIEPNSIFPIASISKFITAVSILILETQGKLSIEDPINDHFPELPQEFSEIKIRHLLNHTTGITDMPFRNRLELYKKQDMEKGLLDYFQPSIIRDKPEKKWEYSNITYMMLSFIIERTTNQSFEKFIHNEFVQKLNLTGTGLCESPKIDSNYTFSYFYPKSTYLTPKYTQKHLGGGGICSNTGDLLKIVRALQNEKLVSPEKVGLLFKPTQLENGMEIYYGLGTKLGLNDDIFLCGHTGGHGTNHAALFWYPNVQIAVVALTNSDPSNAPKLAKEASNSVLDLSKYERKEIDTVEYSGKFNWAGDIVTYQITEKGELVEKIDYGNSVDELTYFYIGNHTFHNSKYNTTLVFGIKNNKSYYVQTFNYGIYVDMDIATRIAE